MSSRVIRSYTRPIFAATVVAASLACSNVGRDTAGITAGVRDDATSIPATEPYIRGAITRVQAGDSVRSTGSARSPDGSVSCPPDCATSGVPLRYVLVEEYPGEPRGNKARAIVLAGARLYRRTDEAVERIGFDALRVGQRVMLWMEGPVAESYPVQGTAGTIVVQP